jgi:hypothetical protein
MSIGINADATSIVLRDGTGIANKHRYCGDSLLLYRDGCFKPARCDHKIMLVRNPTGKMITIHCHVFHLFLFEISRKIKWLLERSSFEYSALP